MHQPLGTPASGAGIASVAPGPALGGSAAGVRVPLDTVLDRAVADAGSTLGAAPRIVRVAADGELMVDGSAAQLALIFGSLLTRVTMVAPAGDAIVLATRRQGSDAVVAITHGHADSAVKSALAFAHSRCAVAGDEEHRSHGYADTALLKRMVQLHGGQLEMGCVHQPSSVEIRLPGYLPHRHSERAAQGEWATAFPPGLRVLVVDRNADAADTLRRVLDLLGVSSRSATRAADAVVMLETYLPTVVLLDVDLPATDIEEVRQRARELEAQQRIVVVAMSARGTQGKHGLQRAEFDHWVAKPADIDVLLGMLRGVGQGEA